MAWCTAAVRYRLCAVTTSIAISPPVSFDSFVLAGGEATQRIDRTSSIGLPAGRNLRFPASYGEDARGELYIVDRDGEVFQLVADEP